MKERKKLSLATWIFISLALGIVVGICFMGNPAIVDTYIKPLGTIFLNLVKFIVVPVVLFSIISGVISMKDIKKVGSIGIKTVIFYLCTTACAIMVGLFFANLFKGSFTVLETSNLAYEVKGATSLSDTIIGIFPSNIAAPFVSANMLQIIVIALFFGFGIILAGEKGKSAAALVESLNEVSMKIMEFIIKLSPIGVFALITPVVATNGPQILGSLAKVLLVAYLCYIIHVVVVYSSTVKTIGGLSPMKFFKGMMPSMMFAFSSASSVGTLPLNLECCQKLGAKKDIASFVLPLGATINMDGAAIYQGVCAVFIATCFGISLTPSQMLTIVLTGEE